MRKRRRLQHSLLYILSHGQIAKQKGRLAGGHTLPSSGLHCRWYAENAVLFRCRLVSSNKVIKRAQVPASNGYNYSICCSLDYCHTVCHLETKWGVELVFYFIFFFFFLFWPPQIKWNGQKINYALVNMQNTLTIYLTWK